MVLIATNQKQLQRLQKAKKVYLSLNNKMAEVVRVISSKPKMRKSAVNDINTKQTNTFKYLDIWVILDNRCLK